MGKLFISSLIR